MKTMLKKFWANEDGGELVEWPLLVALIAVGLILTLIALRTQIIAVLTRITTELKSAAA